MILVCIEAYGSESSYLSTSKHQMLTLSPIHACPDGYAIRMKANMDPEQAPNFTPNAFVQRNRNNHVDISCS